MDPEDLREVISAYQKCITESVRRLGGFVAKHGDGVRVCIDFKENFAVAPLDAPSAWGEQLYVAGRGGIAPGAAGRAIAPAGFVRRGLPSYICGMRSKRRRKRESERRVTTWLVSRVRGTPAAFVGMVDAPDAASAKERAIKQFGVRPEDRDRLIAVPR